MLPLAPLLPPADGGDTVIFVVTLGSMMVDWNTEVHFCRSLDAIRRDALLWNLDLYI